MWNVSADWLTVIYTHAHKLDPSQLGFVATKKDMFWYQIQNYELNPIIDMTGQLQNQNQNQNQTQLWSDRNQIQ